ncbi:hypothetical protein [Paenibacillus ihuae]|uniref:hypothetical protein n=1 Tax=Paenibacillus ihuae TaxID=1232431 RepID=UPI0006D5508A|nr:hypothetical protein [Paenibacillus ihuae]
MSRRYDQNPYLAGEEGEQLLKMAQEKKKHAHDTILSVYELVPAAFHKNIRLLPQKEKLIDKQFDLTADQKAFGFQSYYGKTYIETYKPYVDVEGRIEQMIAVHKVHGAPYTLDTYPEQINDCWVITCTFEGLNKYGQPFKTKERSIIGFGASSGVDSTNPIENASTSAVGRALSHGGYGNIGSGLSSFEDIYIAITRQNLNSKQNNGDKNNGNPQEQQPTDHSGGLGEHGMNEKLPPVQVSGQAPSTGDRSHNQNHSSDRNSSGDQRQRNSQEEPDLKREKNVLVGRLMEATKDWTPADLNAKVKTWLKINWNGRFNSLDVGQLRLVEEHLKAGSRNNSHAS